MKTQLALTAILIGLSTYAQAQITVTPGTLASVTQLHGSIYLDTASEQFTLGMGQTLSSFNLDTVLQTTSSTLYGLAAVLYEGSAASGPVLWAGGAFSTTPPIPLTGTATGISYDSLYKVTPSSTLGAGTYTLSFYGLGGRDIAGTVASTITPVPEPETYALVGLGLVGMLLTRRRKLSVAV